MARRGAKGEPHSRNEITVTVECILEEAKVRGEKEFTISRNQNASKLVAYARSHFGLYYDRGSIPGSIKGRDWRLLRIGGKLDGEYVQKRLPSVTAAGIEDGARLRLVYIHDDADTRSQTPQTSPGCGDLEAASSELTGSAKGEEGGEGEGHHHSHHHHHHHKGQKRHRQHDSHPQSSSPSEPSEEGTTPSVTRNELENVVEDVLDEEGNADGHEMKEGKAKEEQPKESSTSSPSKPRPKRTRVSMAPETPIRRSARVRGIEPDFNSEPPAAGSPRSPSRTTEMETSIVAEDGKRDDPGEVDPASPDSGHAPSAAAAIPKSSSASADELPQGVEEVSKDVDKEEGKKADEDGEDARGKQLPSSSSAVAPRSARGRRGSSSRTVPSAKPAKSQRVHADSSESMRTDEGNQADSSGVLSQPSDSRGSLEGIRVSSSLPVASGGKYPPASSGSASGGSSADSGPDNRPPAPDWLLATPHVRLRRKAEEQMHNNQFAKAVETFRESLATTSGVQGMRWEMLYDCRYQMIICLLEMERHEDCVREAQTNLDLCLGHIDPDSNVSSGSDGLDDQRRLLEARSMLGDLLLLSGRVDEAKEVLRAAVRTDVPCTNTKLSYIVSLCGGLDDTQPVETCSLAFSQLQGLVSSPDRRFDSVVERAKAGCMEEFQAALRTFLLNLDQDVPLPRVQRALFVALGSQTGARGWRAAAKLICQSLVEYEVNQQRVSEHCRPQLEAVRLRLDSSLQPLKSFQEFKDLVESILDKPSALQQACPGMHAMCTKLCKAKLKELCRIAEVSML